jgi:hypothetical protein
LPGPSTIDIGLDGFGVPLGVPVGVAPGLTISTLVFLDDDRGVMLLLMRVLTGVAKSAALAFTVSGVSLRAELRGGGVAALFAPRCWAASLGVIGDLTLPEANVGTSGFPEFAELSRLCFGGILDLPRTEVNVVGVDRHPVLAP